MLQCLAVCLGVLQCVCSVLQCVAVAAEVLTWKRVREWGGGTVELERCNAAVSELWVLGGDGGEVEIEVEGCIFSRWGAAEVLIWNRVCEWEGTVEVESCKEIVCG